MSENNLDALPQVTRRWSMSLLVHQAVDEAVGLMCPCQEISDVKWKQQHADHCVILATLSVKRSEAVFMPMCSSGPNNIHARAQEGQHYDQVGFILEMQGLHNIHKSINTIHHVNK